MSDVFISHSSLDGEIANRLADYLENKGLSCWIAPRNIVPGSDWAASINSAITDCKVFVVIYSSNSSQSDHVVREINLAESRKGVCVIPYKADDTPLTGSFEYFLSSSHWINADYHKNDLKLEELYQIIVGIISNKKPDSNSVGTPSAVYDDLSPVSGDQILKCPSCGISLSYGTQFCPNCGMHMQHPSAEAAQENSSGRKADESFQTIPIASPQSSAPAASNKKIIFIIAVPVCILLIAVICILLSDRPDSSSTPASQTTAQGNAQESAQYQTSETSFVQESTQYQASETSFVQESTQYQASETSFVQESTHGQESTEQSESGKMNDPSFSYDLSDPDSIAIALDNACKQLYSGVRTGTINSDNTAITYSFHGVLPSASSTVTTKKRAAENLTVGEAMEYFSIDADTTQFVYDSSGTIYYKDSCPDGYSLSDSVDFRMLYSQ